MDLESPQEASPVEERAVASAVKDHDDKVKKFKQFYAFCSFILHYEDHMASQQQGEELGVCLNDKKGYSQADRFDDSEDSSSNTDTESVSHSRKQSSESNSSSCEQYSSDDESWNSITCYCGRPFAGRPMIECSECLTWIHLYCAKIKKNKVPETFTCSMCKKKKAS